jgi:hypothetical protein
MYTAIGFLVSAVLFMIALPFYVMESSERGGTAILFGLAAVPFVLSLVFGMLFRKALARGEVGKTFRKVYGIVLALVGAGVGGYLAFVLSSEFSHRMKMDFFRGYVKQHQEAADALQSQMEAARSKGNLALARDLEVAFMQETREAEETRRIIRATEALFPRYRAMIVVSALLGLAALAGGVYLAFFSRAPVAAPQPQVAVPQLNVGAPATLMPGPGSASDQVGVAESTRAQKLVRPIRSLALVGAGVLLIMGDFVLPWATWKNLYGQKRNGFSVSVDHKNDPFCVASGEGSTGGFDVVGITYQKRGDSGTTRKVLVEYSSLGTNGEHYVRAVGGKDGGSDPPTVTLIGHLAGVELRGEEEVERIAVRSPKGGFHNVSDSPALPALVQLSYLLMLLAAIPSRIWLVSIMALPAIACGFYPIVAMSRFVSAAAKLRDYDLILEPALGVGPYVMLLASVLGIVGVALVWLEPARRIRSPAAAAGTPQLSGQGIIA